MTQLLRTALTAYENALLDGDSEAEALELDTQLVRAFGEPGNEELLDKPVVKLFYDTVTLALNGDTAPLDAVYLVRAANSILNAL